MVKLWLWLLFGLCYWYFFSCLIYNFSIWGLLVVLIICLCLKKGNSCGLLVSCWLVIGNVLVGNSLNLFGLVVISKWFDIYGNKFVSGFNIIMFSLCWINGVNSVFMLF